MTRKASAWLAGFAGLAFGVSAEWLSQRGLGRAAAGEFTVGWVLLGCGLLGWHRRPQSRVGILIVLAGFAWFAGTLAWSRNGDLAAIGAAVVFVHRGPLVHAIVGYPSGRPAGLIAWLMVAAGYAWALVVPLATNNGITIAVVMAMLALTVRQYVTATGPERRARLTAIAVAGALAVPLAGGSIARLAGAGQRAAGVVLTCYLVAVGAVAVGLLADALLGRWVQSAVERLVVDLGEDWEAGTLRASLAHAVGDPSLEVAYWLPEIGGFADERGDAIEFDRAAAGREITFIEDNGKRIGALEHDAAVLRTAGFADSLAAAARMAMSNVRLRAEVRGRATELESSRRRIVLAADAQRRGLQEQLQAGVGKRLASVGRYLDLALAQARAVSDAAAAERVAAARADLDEALTDVRELAAGIHPAVLTERGLGSALAELAARAPVPVRLAVAVQRLPPEVETAIYFVCAEALANVAKHARATQAGIEIRSEGGIVTVLVADDGVGGADTSAGSGLHGAADRIEALGGRLAVRSPSGQGTRLVAQIPVPAT